MEDAKETDEGCFFCDRHLDSGIRLEIWPFMCGYTVTVTLGIAKARWWQRWRSDPPLSKNMRQDIIDALDDASTWLCNKGHYEPCCMALRVTFTPSDEG